MRAEEKGTGYFMEWLLLSPPLKPLALNHIMLPPSSLVTSFDGREPASAWPEGQDPTWRSSRRMLMPGSAKTAVFEAAEFAGFSERALVGWPRRPERRASSRPRALFDFLCRKAQHEYLSLKEVFCAVVLIGAAPSHSSAIHFSAPCRCVYPAGRRSVRSLGNGSRLIPSPQPRSLP